MHKAALNATKQEISLPPVSRSSSNSYFGGILLLLRSTSGALAERKAQKVDHGWKTDPGLRLFNCHTDLVVAMVKDKRVEEDEEKERKEIERENEIRREIGKLRRQNMITHCLLSLLIVMTAGWQLTEISLILVAKDTLKDKLRNPFRSLRDVIFSGFRGSGRLEGLDNLRTPSDSNQPLKVSPLPPVAVPEVPHPDLPSLSLDGSE